MPLVVRDSMDDWEFRKATNALTIAEEAMALAREIDRADGTSHGVQTGILLTQAPTMRRAKEIRDGSRALASQDGLADGGDPEGRAEGDQQRPKGIVCRGDDMSARPWLVFRRTIGVTSRPWLRRGYPCRSAGQVRMTSRRMANSPMW